MGRERISSKAAKKRGDPMEEKIEHALRPGDFIGYRSTSDFEQDLDHVKQEIAKLSKAGEAQRAVTLFETFIAGCYLKAEEIDDSSGSFGMFVSDLFCSWIQTRQAAKADATDTAKRLFLWMEKDDYGFCRQLEQDAVKVLSKAGLTAFEGVARDEFHATNGEAERGGGNQTERAAAYRRSRQLDLLKTISSAKGDAAAYLALCGSDISPKDCEAVAEIHTKRKRLPDALTWVERGLTLEGDEEKWRNQSGHRLPQMKRELLKKLGRDDDALQAVWKEFLQCPISYAYDDLMKYVPKPNRKEWHEKALAAAEKSQLDGYIGICTKTKEWDRLASRILRIQRAELEDISHYTMEPAAEGLAKAHPDAAAKVYVALGFRILNAKKSKYYAAAIRDLQKAKRCYQRGDLDKDWNVVVATIRSEHRRKVGFMSDFEQVVSGEADHPKPSFLDKAQERWRQQRS
jgi:hypothetical protein